MRSLLDLFMLVVIAVLILFAIVSSRENALLRQANIDIVRGVSQFETVILDRTISEDGRVLAHVVTMPKKWEAI